MSKMAEELGLLSSAQISPESGLMMRAVPFSKSNSNRPPSGVNSTRRTLWACGSTPFRLDPLEFQISIATSEATASSSDTGRKAKWFIEPLEVLSARVTRLLRSMMWTILERPHAMNRVEKSNAIGRRPKRLRVEVRLVRRGSTSGKPVAESQR